MTKVGFAALVFLALGTASACSDQGMGTEPGRFTSQSSAIQGGSDDGTAHPFAVGICLGVNDINQCTNLQAGICSGALIAPNLVVSARHCVQQTDEQIDCATSVFGSAMPGNIYVTTDPDFTTATHWHAVSKINVPTPTAVCGNDISLITLSDNVPAAEAPLVRPLIQYPITTKSLYSLKVTAIGFGNTSAGSGASGAGLRRIKQNIAMECDDGDPRLKLACSGVYDAGSASQISTNEFITGPGTCQGDSGSSAYDETAFEAGNYWSFGVLSRGGESGSTCQDAIYTRLDKWHDLIVQVAEAAAASGGYPVPDWTKPGPPLPDPDAGSTQPQTGTGQLGDSCNANTDCQSKTCQGSICTQSCDDSNPCPDGYSCGSDGFCAASTPSTNGDTTTTTTTTTSCGCRQVGGPNNPIPWKVMAVAGAAILMRRRRRRSA